MAEDNDRDTERTTIVTTDGDGRGSAGLILLVALVAILLAVLFFGGVFGRDDDSDLNLDVAPDVNVTMPDAQLPPPVIVVDGGQAPPPDVNVNIVAPPAEEPPPAEVNQTNTL